MKTNRCLLSQLFLALSLLLLFSYSVQAEAINCTAIPSLPYTITTQGIYCLTSDLATAVTSGNAITINTNNVVIDLNGHKLGGLAAGAGTTAYGIYAYQRKNITIRNGTVRGFYEGIQLNDNFPYTTSQGHIIEDIRADMNTGIGIEAYGVGNIIRNNQVVNTGGATTTYPGATGIAMYGPGARVLNNDVIETRGGTIQSFGIFLYGAPGAVVKGNRVGNSSLEPGYTWNGIFAAYSSYDVLYLGNSVTMMNFGLRYYIEASGKYRDNLTSGVLIPFEGGTDAGGNN